VLCYFNLEKVEKEISVGHFDNDSKIVFTLVAGLLARSQYPEGPATSHLDTGFSWFPCA